MSWEDSNGTMEANVCEVMSAILGVPIQDIDGRTSVDRVEGWDSLQHLSLILALQEAFDVEFEPDEVSSMLSYGQILRTLKRKMARVGRTSSTTR